MLAAFGFFFNAVKDRIDEALATSTRPANTDAADASCTTILIGRRIALTLGLVAVVVCGLLAPEVVREVKAAIDADFALDKYSTIDAIFVTIAAGWLAIFLFFAWRVWTLTEKLRKVRTAKRVLEKATA